MYDELIELMRYCANDNPVCEKSEACPFYNQAEEDYGYYFCVERMLKQAADVIEELCNNAIAYEEIIDKLESTSQKWIPVTERLPEYDKVVQITDGMEVGHGYLEGIDTAIGVTSFWHSPFCDIDETHITHWMPLPELPKEET